MRARDGPENGDENHQDRAGRQRVAEQRQRDVLGQGFGHDAGADHGRDQQRGPECFGGEPARQIEFGHQLAFSRPEVEPSMRPMSRSLVPSDSRSMLSNGRLVKAAIRFLR